MTAWPQTVEFYREELARAVLEWRRDYPTGTIEACQRELAEIEAYYVVGLSGPDLFPPSMDNVRAVWPHDEACRTRCCVPNCHSRWHKCWCST